MLPRFTPDPRRLWLVVPVIVSAVVAGRVTDQGLGDRGFVIAAGVLLAATYAAAIVVVRGRVSTSNARMAALFVGISLFGLLTGEATPWAVGSGVMMAGVAVVLVLRDALGIDPLIERPPTELSMTAVPRDRGDAAV